MEKKPFYKKTEFKLFITTWIVYIFYMQMFGSSSMANTQSALTAALVNEGRLEIDTYYRAGGNGNAFYNGHYYSGQAPGISFLSVPIYFIGKHLFSLTPQGIIEQLYGMLEERGKYLPEDWRGEKKVLSNYFPGLDKRKILEYVLISGFILPAFTTSLITALSVILLYSLLRHFTADNKLRLLISLFYAFGTLLFPLSTEFFERPIAIALIFASFFILFKAKHAKSWHNKNILLAGFLAGLSTTFDYFHIALAGLLFLYLLHFCAKKRAKALKFMAFFSHGIKPLVYFIAGILIPLFLLGLYHYSAFGSPFTTSYTYRYDPESNAITISKLSNIVFPDLGVIFNMAVFFIYSPIIIIALYGLYAKLARKGNYFDEAVLAAATAAVIFAFSAAVVLSLQANHPLAQSSFKRYLTPMLPFIFMFIPYSFPAQKLGKNFGMKAVFFSIGAVSVFMNWLSAQFGGHVALGHFDLQAMKLVHILRLFEAGPSSSLLSALSEVLGINPLPLNLIGLAFLAAVIYVICGPLKRLG